MSDTQPTYNAAYFIAKFEAIPEEKWTIGNYVDSDGRCCARGHCGETPSIETPESEALMALCQKHLGGWWVAFINDGTDNDIGQRYQGATPKQRVLAWLRGAQAAGL